MHVGVENPKWIKNCQSRGCETSRDSTIRYLIWYWNWSLNLRRVARCLFSKCALLFFIIKRLPNIRICSHLCGEATLCVGFRCTNGRRYADTDHSWWRHHMETFSALLAICAGNSPVTGEFPAQRPVTRNFDVFFDLRLNKRLSKQSWGWRLETPWRL